MTVINSEGKIHIKIQKKKKKGENSRLLSNFPSLSPVFDDTKEQKCCGGRACEFLIWSSAGIFFKIIFNNVILH